MYSNFFLSYRAKTRTHTQTRTHTHSDSDEFFIVAFSKNATVTTIIIWITRFSRGQDVIPLDLLAEIDFFVLSYSLRLS